MVELKRATLTEALAQWPLGTRDGRVPVGAVLACLVLTAIHVTSVCTVLARA
jgi:hypothetical protein